MTWTFLLAWCDGTRGSRSHACPCPCARILVTVGTCSLVQLYVPKHKLTRHDFLSRKNITNIPDINKVKLPHSPAHAASRCSRGTRQQLVEVRFRRQEIHSARLRCVSGRAPLETRHLTRCSIISRPRPRRLAHMLLANTIAKQTVGDLFQTLQSGGVSDFRGHDRKSSFSLVFRQRGNQLVLKRATLTDAERKWHNKKTRSSEAGTLMVA